MKTIYMLPWDIDPILRLREKHPDATFVKAENVEEAIAHIEDTDVLAIAGRFYPGLLAETIRNGARKLRLIQTSSIGVDMFTKDGVPNRIAFCNAAGLKGTIVAEHALALLLGHLHGLPQMERFRARAEWSSNTMREQITSVEGLTLLSLGYGSIGGEVARKAKAFDMKVIAMNRTGTGEGAADEVRALNELNDILPAADVVVISLPSSPETIGLMSAVQFAAMKPSAVVINVGRGAVIDYPALLSAIISRQIAGAALDVFETEPLPPDSPLWSQSNVIISPHVAGTGGASYDRFAALLWDNINRLKNREPLINRVKINSEPV